MPHRIGYLRYQPQQATARSYETATDRRADKAFYASTAWRRLRAEVLAEEPLCPDCLAEGRVEPATEVHHLRERKAAPELALTRDNLQALCHQCHNRRRTPPGGVCRRGLEPSRRRVSARVF
jgi:5-methylcytosine-specific restriction endonuclease McrA